MSNGFSAGGRRRAGPGDPAGRPAPQAVGVWRSMAWLAWLGFEILRGGTFAFNADGQTDIVWQNRATGEIAVWFMNATSFATSGRITNDLGGDWLLSAVADFNRDGESDLLWHSPVSGQNEIWLMSATNRIGRNVLAAGATNFTIVGAGDFNADGYADILWRDHNRDLTAVWFMHGAHWNGEVGWIRKTGDPYWHAVATGDCNNDGYADIYWRHAKTGQNAVWLMRGTNVERIVQIQSEPDLGFQLATTGQFNPLGNTDLLWRHPNGENVIWLMSGTNFLSSVTLPAETNPNWTIAGVGGYANEMTLSASPDALAARLTLAWRYGSTNLPMIRRRTYGQTAWTTQAVSYVPYRFTNSNLTLGGRYEYEVGGQYLLAGLNATPIERRGRVLVLVENSVATALAGELETLRSDLVGDGWSVIQRSVPRHNDKIWSANTNAIASIKSFITNAYYADSSSTKAVLLVGHVPIPYSGFQNPDGHGHRALPADGYYGDVDGIFTDTNINYPSYLNAPHESRHDNRIGDGRFDQNRFPPNSNGVARVELAVGRIDFAKMPIFRRQSETALLRRYLNKDHRYRHKQLVLPDRMGVGAYLPNGLNEEVFGEALKLGSRLFGLEPGSIVYGDPFLPPNAFSWGVLGGFGLPYGVRGSTGVYHESKHLAEAAKPPRLLFAGVFASYCVDLDYTNNFLRAFLGAPDAGLAAIWFRPIPVGYAPLSFEPSALGEIIGTGFLRMINENPNPSADNTYLALLGDPTLRLQILAPPGKLMARGRTNVVLSWNASSEAGAQYFVYRSTNDLAGPWTRMNSAPLVGTWYRDAAAPATPKLYQVRALKLVTTGSGSFTNLSQGVFVKAR